MFKRLALVLLVVFVLAQFVRPDRSVPPVDPATDMLAMTQAPDDIAVLVRAACYDCHSYGSVYPWYVAVTPVNWFMQSHINEARGHLNFSRWDEDGGTKDARQCGKLITEGEMPLWSYTLMHPEARLSATQQQRLASWFDGVTGAGSTAER
jgi:hypothetical protein